MSNLLDLLSADASSPDILRGLIAEVTGIGTGTVTLTVAGGTVANVPVADSYASPTNGDVVLVLKLGSAWLALTRLG